MSTAMLSVSMYEIYFCMDCLHIGTHGERAASRFVISLGWVHRASWEGQGKGCLWGWGITLLPEPCTSPPPTTQVAATERRDEGGDMGSLGQGTAGRLEAGTVLRSSLSSGEHVTCTEMPLGDWAARWAVPCGILLVQQLCLTPYAQRFVYNTGDNVFENQTCLGMIQSSSTTQ